MKLLGIEFAPINIPVTRRLQTLAIFGFAQTFFIPFVSIPVGFYLLFTSYYYVPLLYIAWYVYDRETCHQGARRFGFVRRLPVWDYMRDYFPISLVKTAELNPTRNYILGLHPHGLLALGAIVTFASDALKFEQTFPGINVFLCGLTGWFRLPVQRELLLISGVCSVSKRSIDYILSRGPGSCAAIPVGGAAEVLEAHPNTVSLVLKERKGFVKRAIEHGANLVPVFSFGENEVFSQVSNPPGSRLRKLQIAIKNIIGIYPPIFYGRGVFQYTFGYLPYRKPIAVVVGKPIKVVKNSTPTQEEVDKFHAQYLTELEQLFDKHKEQYGLKDVKMRFI